MLTLPVEEWIGNAAAVLSGVWGAVTHRSEQSGYSRTAIYQHAENEALWQAWSCCQQCAS